MKTLFLFDKRPSGLNCKDAFLVFFICQFFSVHLLNAQDVTNQLWLEYRPTYIFNSKFKVDARFSFRDEFAETNWHTWEARFIPVLKLPKHFDVNLGLSFLETSQSFSLTTSEIRVSPGVRYKLPWKRIDLGAWARVELRWVYKKEAAVWTYTTRPRLRVFSNWPINAKSMKEPTLLYLSSFIEFFFQNNEDLQERYANRFWFRLGLGYKLNQNLRFEVLYNRQGSKNTIDSDIMDLTQENIFIVAVRHNINKQKE